MKKTIIAFSFTLLTVFAFAQPKPDTIVKQPTDTLPADTTPLISIKDIDPLYKEIKKLPYEQVAPFVQYLEQLVDLRMKEYAERRKKNKTKK